MELTGSVLYLAQRDALAKEVEQLKAERDAALEERDAYLGLLVQHVQGTIDCHIAHSPSAFDAGIVYTTRAEAVAAVRRAAGLATEEGGGHGGA